MNLHKTLHSNNQNLVILKQFKMTLLTRNLLMVILMNISLMICVETTNSNKTNKIFLWKIQIINHQKSKESLKNKIQKWKLLKIIQQKSIYSN